MKAVSENSYSLFMENTVMPHLKSVEKTGDFYSTDGKPLRWYSYTCPDSQKALVILHGFTESARKYAEIIWYFLGNGYNVYIYDQRGHGNSFREVSDLTLTHIEHFEDYVSDLECFINQIVPQNMSLKLYSHSMGGAVSALYLEKHTDVFEKAVLSSPMIAPERGKYPLFAGKLICRFFGLLGKYKERIFLSGEYPGEEKFSDSCDTSEERFAFYESYRRATPNHRNYSPTYRWTLESLKVTAKILKKGKPEEVNIPVLLCSALNDTVVINSKQDELARRLPNCCRKFYNCKHEIYGSTDDVMNEYINDVLAFLE